jgi:beta-aspartyl-peptidase (threonine type)
MRQLPFLLLVALLAAALTACASSPSRPARPSFAIAIHGGAGVIDKATTTPEERDAYLASLRSALAAGRDELARGGTAMDACEKVVRILEDDPSFNAGKGAVFTEAGTHELDASIMDGATLKAGAVAGVRTVRNPISLARLVMERTRHILLIADGAEQFATEMAVERVDNSWFDTPKRREALEKELEKRRRGATGDDIARHKDYRGTVGAVALDTHGNLAAATSTGGMTAKKWGRVGDSPIIGAGTYANNKTCAVSGTGTGEQFIRHTIAKSIAAAIEYRGMTAHQAAHHAVHGLLDPDDGGVIVVSHTGEIAMIFNTIGMYRGAADSSGRFEVGIWEEVTK